jgi:hypothetical protein
VKFQVLDTLQQASGRDEFVPLCISDFIAAVSPQQSAKSVSLLPVLFIYHLGRVKDRHFTAGIVRDSLYLCAYLFASRRCRRSSEAEEAENAWFLISPTTFIPS